MSSESGRRFVIREDGHMDTYYGGLGRPDGFGHGHYNHDTGYNRPAMNNDALGWAAIMAGNKCNIDFGGSPW